MPSDRKYGGPTASNQQPAKIVQNAPAASVRQALANSQAVVDATTKAKRR